MLVFTFNPSHIYTDELLSLLAKNIELSSDIIRHHHNIFISLNVVLYLIMGSSTFTVKKATCKHALSSTILFILHITTREMLEISLKFQSIFKEFAFLSTHHISVQQRQARLSASYRKQPYQASLSWTILPKKALQLIKFIQIRLKYICQTFVTYYAMQKVCICFTGAHGLLMAMRGLKAGPYVVHPTPRNPLT